MFGGSGATAGSAGHLVQRLILESTVNKFVKTSTYDVLLTIVIRSKGAFII